MHSFPGVKERCGLYFPHMTREVPVLFGYLRRPFFGENIGRWSTVSSLISLHGKGDAGQGGFFAGNPFSIFDGPNGRLLEGVATFPCGFSTQAISALDDSKVVLSLRGTLAAVAYQR